MAAEEDQENQSESPNVPQNKEKKIETKDYQKLSKDKLGMIDKILKQAEKPQYVKDVIKKPDPAGSDDA